MNKKERRKERREEREEKETKERKDISMDITPNFICTELMIMMKMKAIIGLQYIH